MSDEKKQEYEKKAINLYITYIFLKGAKCCQSVPNMEKDLDRLYETHKNKDVYPWDLAAIILHRQKCIDDGRKSKKDKERKDKEETNETAGNEEEKTKTIV